MRRADGLTILEVLIAIAVIGAVFAALAALQLASLQVTNDARTETQRLERAVDEFELVKRDIEDDFSTFLSCTTATEGCAWSTDGVTIAIQGRPSVYAGQSLSTKGLVEVDITVTDDAGSLEFRQFVSCLDSTTEPQPSVANPGDECS